VITHHVVDRPAWKTFADLYGTYDPHGPILLHPPGTHNRGYCVETRTKPDSTYVGTIIVQSARRRTRSRQRKLKAVRQRRKDHHGELAAADL
jgi:hypothetical protein